MFNSLHFLNYFLLIYSFPLCLSADCAKCAIIESERIKNEKKDSIKSDYFEDFQSENSNNLPVINKAEKNAVALVDELAISPVKKKFSLNKNPEVDKSTDTNASTFADILAIDGLLEIFKEPFTLLIPSDSSIENFPSQIVSKLFKEKNRELLLSYIANHIVAHQILVKDFNKPFKTIGGRVLEISETADGLTINDTAKVLKSIAVGKHGVIYVVDQVLLPIHKY